jgi:pyruvate/2-oxoglutarate dehydrogenase complex dihydrolipoamide acyltransferase (E2) component
MSSSATDRHEAGSSASRPGPATAVTMPQMGVSVAEGTIVEWLKQPGDAVEADEPVCMVTTDKVDVEIPAPASGRMGRILVEPDETVPVGTPLAEIEGGEADGDDPAEDSSEPERATDGPAPNGEPDRSAFHSPVVQRIAAEHEIDLASVEGTGIGGRVRKRDLLALIEAAPAQGERPLHIESPYVPEPAPEAAPAPESNGGPVANGAATANGAEHRERMTPMRRRIAEHMLESRRTSAHCTTIVEADLSAVVAARKRQKPAMADRGVPLTYLAFVARATVEALQRHPVLNASIDGEEIVHHGDVNLGIAVALEAGLIVPVITRAQRLSLEGMAAAIGELAERAREGALEPDDVQGGTFTITNPGQFGAVLATPIINQPQVAILDLEAVVKRPVVISDESGADAIAIRPMTNLCMSWDHRALDGAVAARFLGDVKQSLEGWEAER